MKLITTKTPHQIVASKNKQIRGIDDVYTSETKDEEGNIISEHFPYYTDTIYVPDSFTEEDMKNQYVEEKINE